MLKGVWSYIGKVVKPRKFKLYPVLGSHRLTRSGGRLLAGDQNVTGSLIHVHVRILQNANWYLIIITPANN